MLKVAPDFIAERDCCCCVNSVQPLAGYGFTKSRQFATRQVECKVGTPDFASQRLALHSQLTKLANNASKSLVSFA